MAKSRARERFWALVDRDSTPDGCWPWLGRLIAGYGRRHTLVAGERYQLAHRIAYAFAVGPIPEGLTLDHLCRNRACCNPSHLEPVTNGENVMRGTGMAPVNAIKTHCVRGHPFDAANTYWHGTHRNCRACGRVRSAASRRNSPSIREANGSTSGETARVVPAELYTDQNGAITCLAHRPSSDFHTERLTVAEVDEWRGFIAETYGPTASACEGCRSGQRPMHHWRSAA